MITNGTTRTWLEIGASEVDRAALSLPEDRFVWAYAGNLGIAQGLDAAIDAAGLLGDGYQLLLLVDGPVRESLEQRARMLSRGSVAFHGLVEPVVAARYLRAADALLVPLDAQPALRKYVPSKLFDCCAVGRPVTCPGVRRHRRVSRMISMGDRMRVVGSLRMIMHVHGRCWFCERARANHHHHGPTRSRDGT